MGIGVTGFGVGRAAANSILTCARGGGITEGFVSGECCERVSGGIQ